MYVGTDCYKWASWSRETCLIGHELDMQLLEHPSCRFMLELTEEQHAEFVKKISAMACNVGCKVYYGVQIYVLMPTVCAPSSWSFPCSNRANGPSLPCCPASAYFLPEWHNIIAVVAKSNLGQHSNSENFNGSILQAGPVKWLRGCYLQAMFLSLET